MSERESPAVQGALPYHEEIKLEREEFYEEYCVNDVKVELLSGDEDDCYTPEKEDNRNRREIETIYLPTNGIDAEFRARQKRNDVKIIPKSEEELPECSSLQCFYCEKKYSVFQDLKDHEATHCEKADAANSLAAMTLKDRKKIKKQKSGETYPFRCTICERLFKTYGNLKVHQSRHIVEKGVRCLICNEIIIDQETFNNHMRSHGPQFNECKHCARICKSESALLRHLGEIHGEEPFSCHVCGRRFKLNKNLMRHMIAHSDIRPHQCDLCGKVFKRPHHFKLHLETHTNEKNFKCDYCGKLFRRKDNLNSHRQIHDERKRIECFLCGKMFQSKRNVLAHLRVHKEKEDFTGRRKKCTKKCFHCGEKFNNDVDALQHHCMRMRQLYDDDSKCHLCAEKFYTEIDLLQHRCVK